MPGNDLARHRYLLDLAREQPLNLSFTGFHGSIFWKHWYGTATLRISSLNVQVTPEELKLLGDALQQGLPALEHLGISHKGQYRCSYSHLCVGRALLPRLWSLCYPIQSMVLGCADDQLRHLDMFGCACESCGEPVHTAPLKELLAGYLRLETLTLHYTILNTVFDTRLCHYHLKTHPPSPFPSFAGLPSKLGSLIRLPSSRDSSSQRLASYILSALRGTKVPSGISSGIL